MSLREHVDELNGMILQGQILDAFDKFYAEDVVMEEDGDKREGFDENRAYEEQFVSALQEFHAGEVLSVAVNEDEGVAAVEWYMDMTLEGAGRVELQQVALQRWEDGKVVHERFYKLGG
jgi:hypothetical protein